MSSVSNAMAAQGYIAANKREACCNCMDGQEQTEGLAPRWWCSEGAFRVTALGWCPKHRPRGFVDGPLIAAAEVDGVAA